MTIGARIGAFIGIGASIGVGVGVTSGGGVSQTTTSVAMTDSADPAQAGVNFSYAVTATNTGAGNAFTVSAVVTLDASLTFVSASGNGWTCVNSSGTVTCTRTAMGAGVAPVITITVTAGASAGSITSSVAVTASNAATSNGSQGTTIVVVTKDATGHIFFPATQQEWRALGSRGQGAAFAIRGFQDASGNVVDSVAALNWVVGSTPTYQQAVTGLARKGITVTQTAGMCFQLLDGTTAPHPSQDSIGSVDGYIITASGGTRVLRAFAAGNLAYSILSTGKLFLSVQNQTATTGTYDYRDGAEHTFIFRYNRATRTVSVMTDKEILTAVWNDITEGRHGFGSSASTPPACTCFYNAEFTGEAAETLGAQTLVDMGYTLSYSVASDTGTSVGTHLTDTIDGTRPAVLQVPAASRYDAKGGPYPLVVLLPYYGGNTGVLEQSDLSLGSATNGATQNLKDLDGGYVILALTGKTDHVPNHFWNADSACCDTDASGINDAGYIKSMIDQAIANYPINSSKVWVIGRSNGAFMAQSLACAYASTITAFVALQGGMACNSSGTINQTCTPSQPVHALIYAHTGDPTYLYAGSFPTFNTPFIGTFASVTSNLNKWIANNGGGGSLQAAYGTVDILASVAGAETSQQAVSNTPVNGAVELWTNSAAIHITAGAGMYSTNAIYLNFIAWLNAHPRT